MILTTDHMKKEENPLTKSVKKLSLTWLISDMIKQLREKGLCLSESVFVTL